MISRSEQIRELFLGEASLADEGAECALGEFTMIGDGQPPAEACRKIRWLPL
jgi:hypothetical protein